MKEEFQKLNGNYLNCAPENQDNLLINDGSSDDISVNQYEVVNSDSTETIIEICRN